MPDENRLKTFALWAVSLAILGIVVAMVGERVGNRFLETKLGPAVTLAGAGVWLFAKVSRRRRR